MTKIKVGGIVFAAECDQTIESLNRCGRHTEFLTSGEVDVLVSSCRSGFPEQALREGNVLFDSLRLWKFCRVGGKTVLLCRTSECDTPYCIAQFSSDFHQVDVYFREPKDGAPKAHPLSYPLLPLLAASVMARHDGMVTHSCGIADGGEGYLFLGHTGHGKSTLARLWSEAATILCDDRNILRGTEGAFWLYGTPWHSTLDRVSSERVPLSRVFVIHHGDKQHARRMGIAEATASLLEHGLLPFWDHPGLQRQMDLVARVASQVPCHELGFTPDRSIIDFIRCVK